MELNLCSVTNRFLLVSVFNLNHYENKGEGQVYQVSAASERAMEYSYCDH